MKKELKNFLREWLPPIIVCWISGMKGVGNRFEGNYANWEEARAQCGGYDSKDILEKVLTATRKVKSGEAVYERDSVIFDSIEYTWPVTSGLMWAAARNNGQLNVLDFGGSLGSSYFQNRKLLEALPQVAWNVVEQPHYVEAGQEYIQDEQLGFYKTIDECLLENQPNVILLSSVLQYLEDPMALFKKLSSVNATCLIIDKTPFSSGSKDKLLVQRVPSSIYSASYPMWVFSMQKFLQILEPDWHIIAHIDEPEGRATSVSGFGFSFQGILMELRK
jgi:putative methyltransferase (TIGR04325 family)